MRDVCEMFDIRKTYTASYHSGGNSLVERTKRTIYNILLAFTKDDHVHEWDGQLPVCLLPYHGATHYSIGLTPHHLRTGHDLRLPNEFR
ncbi:unnamed protein product [Schistocephalus solidus]|uniref:Integrase catalytic domain-containing protein n=1 Tax=Schistocephalus solidus TaxID=70667 RepID=A0A183SP36_SCHSO|nr:unnamed protein product [Schistocephalus solidus]